MIPSLALLAGCAAEDPLVAAWHHPLHVEVAEEGAAEDGSCAPELSALQPETEWLFVATQEGTPAVSSLYWCTAPEACPVTPWANVWITRWTEEDLEGSVVLSTYVGRLCTVQWTGLEAHRTADGEVDLTVSTTTGELHDSTTEDCDAFAASLSTGDACDVVEHYVGSQILE
ncbi:MAG: hypothetical protein H6738_22195 [Alphaproteobacteria bacterium]|nr:hypothetical protein [Alphaproteobacteria bacterium]MCB9699511.1 hypothetical protein [Alphaproteobacteria bacterium]